MNIIPSKNRKEWRQLLKGELDISFNNFFYQAKILQAREQIKRGKVNIDDAIDEIYELTTQYCETEQVYDDIAQIFGMETVQKKVISESKNELTSPIVKEEEPKIIISEASDNIIKKEQVVDSKEITPQQTQTEIVDLEKEREKARKQINKRLEEERQRRETTKKRNALVKKTSLRKPIDARFVTKPKSRKTKPLKKNKSFWDSVFGK